ncbi:MAG TPA: excinuclease ABC subunit UvrC [Chitinivibrionales bacterium]
MDEAIRATIMETVDRFPHDPGVYLMKDARDTPIYIGKAVDLKNRVRSYFFDTHADRPHINVMLERLHHIEWIATTSETEALILEANLIRKHTPHFNIDLKDDKHYPYLKITVDEPFPRLLVVRRIEQDKGLYFGPYTDARALHNLIHYSRRIFKIRDCKRTLPLSKPVRPCVNYAIGRCSGACAGLLSPQQYRRSVELFIRFIKGQRSECVAELRELMRLASEKTDFEAAAQLRDQIQLIEDASKLQKVDLASPDVDCDVLGIYKGDRSLCLAILHFREGLLLSARRFVIDSRIWEIATPDRETALLQYYREPQQEAPPLLCIPDNEGFDAALIEQWFLRERGARVQVVVPRKGVKRRLMDMAEKNARLYLMQKAPLRAEDDLHDLQKLLMLPGFPRIIEAFDISNIGSAFCVAGMVHFEDGVAQTSQYRRYKIKTVEGPNDFAMIMEAVTRRLARLVKEGKAFPDCLLIDGGLGQLHAAQDALRQFTDPPMIIALAKKEELLYSPYASEPVALPATHPVRKLVERIRDEVHRWAIAYHRHLRGRQFKATLLSGIPGIGPKKAIVLLRKFGSISTLREATIEQIAEVEGFSMASAQKLHEQLKD